MSRNFGSPEAKNKLTRRGLILLGGQASLMVVLGLRMRQLGVDQSEQFRLLAEENRINIRLIPPARGVIFDRQGVPLATNQPNYSVVMVREQADDPRAVLTRLATLIPLPPEEIERVLADMAKRSAFVPVTVATHLAWEHIAAVSANAPGLPGITPEVGLSRLYPKSADFAHIVGYVGPVSDYDLSKTEDRDPLLQIPKFQIGKNGVEYKVEKPLRGSAGIKRIEVNAVGRVMREIDRTPGKAGTNIQLSLDHNLQSYAQDRLGDKSASAVVMDVRSGDLVAMASAPTFDPNKFVTGISVADYKGLNENKYRPLFNKSVSGAYPPGSTFKMVVALAALEAGVIDPGDQVYCPGHLEMGGRRFHCWRRGGHGRVNLKESLKYSCDVFYYEVASKVGIEKISAMATKLGLGTRHDLPLRGITSGTAPTKAWKQSTKGKSWVIGDTLNAGIGQGFVLASPLQLALMGARIASGTRIEPRLLNAIDNQPEPILGQEKLDIDPAHLAAVRRGMFAVSNERRGTAYGSRIKTKGFEMAGKTGTSQVRFITKKERASGVIRNEDLPWERRDHALFVAFAPFDNPKYAISVIVEHGGGGSKVAAPIARDIMWKALNTEDPSTGIYPSQRRSFNTPYRPATRPAPKARPKKKAKT